MAIQSGTLVGPYEILSAIGAGGMGEIYRVHDPKLGRDVAIVLGSTGWDGDVCGSKRRCDVSIRRTQGSLQAPATGCK